VRDSAPWPPDPQAERRWNRTRRPQTHELEKLAEHLALSPATVSLVINRSSVADSIPQATKDRIFAAARKFKYRPNFFARSLRTSAVLPSVSLSPRSATLFRFRHERRRRYLLQEGYFYFVASHRHRADLIDEYPRMFLERSVDGLIAVDTPWNLNLSVPVAPCPDITTSRASPTLS